MKRFTLAERVKKGARFLTKYVSEDWIERINTETLDLGHCRECILAQTEDKDEFGVGAEGDYHDHKRALGLTDKQAADLGFLGYSALINNRVASARYGTNRSKQAMQEHIRLTKQWLRYLGADNA